MTKGIKIPIRVDIKGGAVVGEGKEILQQNILLGLMPASSMNPWNQELTPREDTIFQIAHEELSGLFMNHVYTFFEEMRRLKLATISKSPDAVRINMSNVENGDYDIVIKYVDLEENDSREIRIPGGR